MVPVLPILSISAGEAVGLIAVSTGFVSALGAVIALAFRHQFIAERKELKHIRRNTKHLRYMADSLADGQQSLRQLVEFNLAGIHHLYDLADPDSTAAMLKGAEGLRDEADRGLHELMVLSPRGSDRLSGARHLSEESGEVRSLRIIRWLNKHEPDHVVRQHLKEAGDRLETVLNKGR